MCVLFLGSLWLEWWEVGRNGVLIVERFWVSMVLKLSVGLMRVDGEGWNSYHVQTQCCCSCTCSHFVARIWKTCVAVSLVPPASISL
jgi:hypothetical protein